MTRLQLRGLNKDLKGEVVPLHGSVTVGRSPECDVILADLQASRRHTRFFVNETGDLLVEDLHSSNGTFLNNVPVNKPIKVSAGDVVRLGSVEFRVESARPVVATIVSGFDAETHYKRLAKDILGEMKGGGLHGLNTMERAGLQRKANKNARYLQSLYEMSCLIQEYTDPDEMIDVALTKLLSLLGGDNAYLLVVREDGTLHLRSSRTAPGRTSSDFRISKTLTQHVIDEKCAVIAPDIRSDRRFNTSQSIITGASRSILAAPIILGNVVKGMVALGGEEALDDSSQEDLELLCICVSIIGPALRNLDLVREIEETQREVLYIMGSIGETRSRETGNHVKRVAEYSRLLAHLVGLDDDSAELLKQASPMHDIGKVGIPDRILNKPGKLDAEEWAIMQTHARLGYDMLNHSTRPILKAAAIVAHEHHEKWNGKGYPRQLKGEEIHIYGRITAIADVFDALGSERCYKKAWPLERIMDLLRRERGEHFDPTLIDLLFEHLPKFLEIRDRFVDVIEPTTSQ